MVSNLNNKKKSERWKRWRASFAPWGVIGHPRKDQHCPCRLNGWRCRADWQESHGRDPREARLACGCEMLDVLGLENAKLWALNGKPFVLTAHVVAARYGIDLLHQSLEVMAMTYDLRVCLYAPSDSYMAISTDPDAHYSMIEMFSVSAPVDILQRELSFVEGDASERLKWWLRSRV